MARRRLLAIVGAVLLTLFGTVVLIAYVNAAERRAQKGAEFVGVLVAAKEIPAGTPAADLADRIERREVTGATRPEDAITSLDDLRGKVTLDRILKDMPIVARQFGDRATAQGSGESGVEEGHEIVTIGLDPQRALGGEVAEGDRVGVIVSLDDPATDPGDAASSETTTSGDGATTAMVLAGVRVSDVAGVDPESGDAANTLMVSFDVDQSDAERMVFGAEYGRIWLTRQAEEGPGVDGDRQTRETIFRNLGGRGS